MLFKEFLDALRAKGRIAEAEHYERAVAERFGGILSKEGLYALKVDDIIGILNIAKALQHEFKASPLEAYVADLRARGFSVSVGEKYRGTAT